MAIVRITLATLSGQLLDRWERVPFWSSEEARLVLNEALRTWNMLTGMWKRPVVLGLEIRDPWVPLPGAILQASRVSSLERPLGYSTLFDLDFGRPGWESEHTRTGGDVPTVPRKWAPAGLTLLAIWPASAEGCTTITVDGVADTPQLVDDDDFVDLKDSELHALLGEALHIAAFKEGGTRWDGTSRYHREFLMAAADRNARLQSSTFFRRYLGGDLNREQHKIREPVEQVAGGMQ